MPFRIGLPTPGVEEVPELSSLELAGSFFELELILFYPESRLEALISQSKA